MYITLIALKFEPTHDGFCAMIILYLRMVQNPIMWLTMSLGLIYNSVVISLKAVVFFFFQEKHFVPIFSKWSSYFTHFHPYAHLTSTVQFKLVNPCPSSHLVVKKILDMGGLHNGCHPWESNDPCQLCDQIYTYAGKCCHPNTTQQAHVVTHGNPISHVTCGVKCTHVGSCR